MLIDQLLRRVERGDWARVPNLITTNYAKYPLEERKDFVPFSLGLR